MNNKNNDNKNKKKHGLVLIPEKGILLPTEEAFEDIPKEILIGLDTLIDRIEVKHKLLDKEEFDFMNRRLSVYKEEGGIKKAVGKQLYNMRKDFLSTLGKVKIRLR